MTDPGSPLLFRLDPDHHAPKHAPFVKDRIPAGTVAVAEHQPVEARLIRAAPGTGYLGNPEVGPVIAGPVTEDHRGFSVVDGRQGGLGHPSQPGSISRAQEGKSEIQILRQESGAGLGTAGELDFDAIPRLRRLRARQHQSIRTDHDARGPVGASDRLEPEYGSGAAGREGPRTARPVRNHLDDRTTRRDRSSHRATARGSSLRPAARPGPASETSSPRQRTHTMPIERGRRPGGASRRMKHRAGALAESGRNPNPDPDRLDSQRLSKRPARK